MVNISVIGVAKYNLIWLHCTTDCPKKINKKNKWSKQLGTPKPVYHVFTSNWERITKISQSEASNTPASLILLHHWSGTYEKKNELQAWSTVIIHLATPIVCVQFFFVFLACRLHACFPGECLFEFGRDSRHPCQKPNVFLSSPCALRTTADCF